MKRPVVVKTDRQEANRRANVKNGRMQSATRTGGRGGAARALVLQIVCSAACQQLLVCRGRLLQRTAEALRCKGAVKRRELQPPRRGKLPLLRTQLADLQEDGRHCAKPLYVLRPD